MNARILLAFSFLVAASVPAHAQFAITVQQNGQAFSEANGGNITMNAPGVGQAATATVTITNVGANTIVFPSSAQLFGGSTFSITGGGSPSTLTQFQSATLTFAYTPTSTAQTVGEFQWLYNEVATTNSSNGPVTTTVASGAVSFNLIGTAPNLVIGNVLTGGTFQTIANGGTFQFQNTSINATSTVTVAISNAGSGPGTINSITVSGAGYTLVGVPLLPLTIAAGNQLNFTVQFQPTASGNAPGSLQIAFANGTYTAVLAGTGVASGLSYTLTQGATTSALVPGQTITLNGTPVGTSTSAIVQFTNTGISPFVLSNVAISGAGFSLTDGPFLPITLQPQQSNSITVTYTPTQAGPSSGRLLIGGDSFAISAQALGATLTYAYQQGSGPSIPIVAGGIVSFSPIVDGQTESIQFTVSNTGTTAATVASIGVVDPTGVFTVSGLPAIPLQLAPAASVSFSINYSPIAPAISSATLAINSVAFGLNGFPATPPPLPSYTFTGASGTQQPFQQPSVGLTLSSAYSYPVYGTLTAGVLSGSFAADPAVQFSSGGNQVAFTIPANSVQAVFPNGSTQIQLQTGTVAGIIRIIPTFNVGDTTGTNITPSSPTALSLTIPSLAPTLLTASISAQSASSLSVAVTGFSTIRSVQKLTFQLTPASGFTLSGASFSVDVSAGSSLWFAGSTAQTDGGEFTIQVPFTFSENSAAANTNLTAAISSVSVSATNSIGTSNVIQVTIP